ncbi:MAG: cupin domain-containing protein, partial [Candidatus Competibacteraceae bacterium]|nr:cupin domain-containing protein [Candidatus Competibacteraceae bacterium]
MSSAQFLAEYWQQKPLLVRAAWPAFSNPISPEELAGLACEDEVCARLVRQSKQRWQVRHGPFKETDFTRLPAKRWTVLVPDMEKHLPDLRSILEPFRFIPDWRIDDLMISYAAEQGSVGPHVDEYDVFLLQGLGRRRWQIDTRPVAPDNYQADSELRILQHFEAESEWILEPGDML